MKRFWATSGLVACIVFLTALPLLAQEGEASPADSTSGWIFRWLNFAIVFGAIAYFAVKKGGPYFRARADEIAQKIEEGARARKEAEERRKEIEAKLANLPNDVQQMRAEAKRSGEAEAQRIRTMARQEAEKIEQSAQAEIIAAERAARLELKVLAARMAVDQAHKVLESGVTPDAEVGLFRTFVAELSEGSSN